MCSALRSRKNSPWRCGASDVGRPDSSGCMRFLIIIAFPPRWPHDHYNLEPMEESPQKQSCQESRTPCCFFGAIGNSACLPRAGCGLDFSGTTTSRLEAALVTRNGTTNGTTNRVNRDPKPSYIYIYIYVVIFYKYVIIYYVINITIYTN